MNSQLVALYQDPRPRTMSVTQFSQETVEGVGTVLVDSTRDLAERFRALFTLRGIGTEAAIRQISRCFDDPSALLKHECAYCLGQIQDARAIQFLKAVLEDSSQEPMVRHEAAEALGAIGDTTVVDFLKKYIEDSAVEVAETCQIALERIEWLNQDSSDFRDNNPYCSVDPAPPLVNGSIKEWQKTLNDTALSLFMRYRAMFALRNHGGRDAVLSLASSFVDSSALFKHELAYILGQMKHEAAVSVLVEKLSDLSENPMVRHECAEALGSIASEECIEVLQKFQNDGERVVRESCMIALDMYEYEKSSAFQYADTVSKIC